MHVHRHLRKLIIWIMLIAPGLAALLNTVFN